MATLAIIILTGAVTASAANAACRDLTLKEVGKGNLMRDLGISYTPLSKKYMSPCLKAINHSGGAYQVLGAYQVPDFVVFYRTMRELNADNRDGGAFTKATIYTGISKSRGVSLDANARRILQGVAQGLSGRKLPTVHSKVLSLGTVNGWRDVTITYHWYPNVSQRQSLAAASLSARPPADSVASANGVKTIVGYTLPVKTKVGSEALPAFQLQDVLRALTMLPANSQFSLLEQSKG